MSVFTESVVKHATLAWLAALGYVVLRETDIAATETLAERVIKEAQ